MAEKKYRRRNYLINPAFQLRFMAYVAMIVLGSLTVLYASNYLYFDELVQQGNELYLDDDHPYFEFIREQRALLLKTYLAVSAVVFVIVMILMLLLSHKIAGPLYQIGKVMTEPGRFEADGRLVHLRRGDFFQEMEGFTNDLILGYRKEVGRSKSASTNDEAEDDNARE